MIRRCLKCNGINTRPRAQFCSHDCAVHGYLKTCKNCKKDFRGRTEAQFCSKDCYYKSEDYKNTWSKNPILNKRPPKEFYLCKYCNIKKRYDEFRQVNKNLHLGFKKKGGWRDIEGKQRYALCRSCESLRQKDKRDERPAHRLYILAKRRAKKENLDFNITTEYLEKIWPSNNKCPIMGTEFKSGLKNKHVLPTLDKVVREKGYVKGNVAIISFKANQIKSDVDDFEIFLKLYDYAKKF